MKFDPGITDWARGHYGLVTFAAWHSFGLSRSSFDRAVRAGVLIRLLPSVAALAGTEIGPRQRIAAGILHHGPRSVASHCSSGYLWDADVAGDDPVDLLLLGKRRSTQIAGYRLHRWKEPEEVPVRVRHGTAFGPLRQPKR